ncbi:hypothetical protein JXQ31_08105, partial [candidate division KSB1 bacterium]|nr:hypothetical protein [candidate division KSB1 bacterium]
MKKIIIVFALYITNCFPQNDSTSLSFYPLNTGNYWEYKEIEFEGPYIFETNYFSITVTGDTMLTNGKYYKIIEKQYLNSSEINFVFERIDSLTGNVYRYYNEIYPDYNKDEYLIDSLRSQVGDSCTAQRLFKLMDKPVNIFMSENIDSVFNRERHVKYFVHASYIPGYDYELVKDIGLYVFTNRGEIRSTRLELIYANINGKEYGEKIQDGINEGSFKLKSFQLKQNYPNPFNSDTKIQYVLNHTGHIKIQIFNIYSQHLKTLYDREQKPGMYST